MILLHVKFPCLCVFAPQSIVSVYASSFATRPKLPKSVCHFWPPNSCTRVHQTCDSVATAICISMSNHIKGTSERLAPFYQGSFVLVIAYWFSSKEKLRGHDDSQNDWALPKALDSAALGPADGDRLVETRDRLLSSTPSSTVEQERFLNPKASSY